MSPGNRNAGFIVSIDMGTMPTFPDRMIEQFRQSLMFHLQDAAQRVIDTARHYLVRLEESPVKINDEGIGIHGYDTGLMYTSLKYALAFQLLATGVYYDLFSEEAKYWRYVEFGHWVASGSGWWFWPGYHFLETAIEENAGYIRQQVREAWADTAIRLAMEAHVPGTSGRLGFTKGTGIGGVANVANIHPGITP
jgi:hypothetical protein